MINAENFWDIFAENFADNYINNYEKSFELTFKENLTYTMYFQNVFLPQLSEIIKTSISATVNTSEREYSVATGQRMDYLMKFRFDKDNPNFRIGIEHENAYNANIQQEINCLSYADENDITDLNVLIWYYRYNYYVKNDASDIDQINLIQNLLSNWNIKNEFLIILGPGYNLNNDDYQNYIDAIKKDELLDYRAFKIEPKNKNYKELERKTILRDLL